MIIYHELGIVVAKIHLRVIYNSIKAKFSTELNRVEQSTFHVASYSDCCEVRAEHMDINQKFASIELEGDDLTVAINVLIK